MVFKKRTLEMEELGQNEPLKKDLNFEMYKDGWIDT